MGEVVKLPTSQDSRNLDVSESSEQDKKKNKVPKDFDGGDPPPPPPPVAPPDNRKTVANETAKLSANFLDRAATTCLTVGAATPLTGWLFGVSGLDHATWQLLTGVIACWLGAAALLHYAARRVLRGLIP